MRGFPINTESENGFDEHAAFYHEIMGRDGISLEDAKEQLRSNTTVIAAQVQTVDNKKVIVVEENGNGASRLVATAKLPGYEEPSTFNKVGMGF